MSSSVYLVPGISAATAILVGFGAAGLKHHWDVEDNTVRWGRERDERRRDELRAAFARYLAAREALDDWVRAGNREHAAVDTEFFLASTALQIILVNPDDASKIDSDTTSMGGWQKAYNAGFDIGAEPQYPSGRSIMDMAKRLQGPVA